MIRGHMATYPARAPNLEVTLAAIAPQVEQLFLCLNEYDDVPAFLSAYKNVVPYIPAQDLKDSGKFVFEADAEDDVFLLDDDLHYAPDYVAHMMSVLPEAADKAVVLGVHGSTMVEGFENRGFRRTFHKMRKPLESSLCVDFVGTGTVYTKGRNLPPFEVMKSAQKFTDIRFAKWCFENGITHICVARKGRLIVAQETEESIFHSFTKVLPDNVLGEVKEFGRKHPHLGQTAESFIATLGKSTRAAGELKGN